MLQKYLELLRNGLDAITGLSIHDATFLDYITAVGYEFAIILLGLLVLVICVAVVAGPFVLIWRIKKKMYVKVHQKDDTYHELDLFPSYRKPHVDIDVNGKYNFEQNLAHNYSFCADAWKKFKQWKASGKKIENQAIIEAGNILERMAKLTKNFDIYSFCADDRGLSLQCLWCNRNAEIKKELMECVQKIIKIATDSNIYTQLNAAKKEATTYKKKVNRILWGISVGTIFVWLIFLIPLVLMFF